MAATSAALGVTADTTVPTVGSTGAASLDHNTGSLVVTVSEQVTSGSVDLTKWAVWDGASPPAAVVSSLAGASLVSSASPGAVTVSVTLTEAQRCLALLATGAPTLELDSIARTILIFVI